MFTYIRNISQWINGNQSSTFVVNQETNQSHSLIVTGVTSGYDTVPCCEGLEYISEVTDPDCSFRNILILYERDLQSILESFDQIQHLSNTY